MNQLRTRLASLPFRIDSTNSNTEDPQVLTTSGSSVKPPLHLSTRVRKSRQVKVPTETMGGDVVAELTVKLIRMSTL